MVPWGVMSLSCMSAWWAPRFPPVVTAAIWVYVLSRMTMSP